MALIRVIVQAHRHPGITRLLTRPPLPRSRSDRSVVLFSFLCGPSEEGGREDMDES